MLEEIAEDEKKKVVSFLGLAMVGVGGQAQFRQGVAYPPHALDTRLWTSWREGRCLVEGGTPSRPQGTNSMRWWPAGWRVNLSKPLTILAVPLAIIETQRSGRVAVA